MNNFRLHKLSSPFLNCTRSLIKGGKPGPENQNICCLPPADYGPPPVHRADFLNGMRVAAARPEGGDIAACTIMFQVGSRHEFGDYLGATHFLRTASSTSGLTHSGFIRSRYLQQEGGYITCSSDRQTISYTMRCPEPVFADLKCFLTDAAARCQYPDHELDEIRKLVREELENRPPEEHVIDLVQKACFKGTLSNSVYCEEDRVDQINSEILNDFVGCFFKTNVCTVGSTDVCYGETMKVASQIDCCRSNCPPVYCMPMSYPRGGYEFYDTGPGPTYMAFAVPGAGTCDFYCFLKHAILAAACGLDKSQEPLCLLSKEENDAYTDYKAFNISYLDTGCFGILVKTSSKMARCAGFKAAQFLGNIKTLDCSQIEIGKKRLKLGAMLNDDSCVRYSESLALQIANNVCSDSAVGLGCLIDKVPAEEVLAVANCIAEKRMLSVSSLHFCLYLLVVQFYRKNSTDSDDT